MRVSEALGLRWRDIQGKMATIHNTKNGDSRSVPLTKRLLKLLESLDKDGAGPFCTLNRFRVSDVCQWARERTSMKGDKEVVPHTLRHTCASRLVRRGAPIFMVKEWLGHKSLVMVQRYAHLSPEVLTDYVKLLDK
jgi:integrase